MYRSKRETLMYKYYSCPAFTAIYTSALSSFASSSNPALHVISPLVWQQVILGYSIMTALAIALMPFLKSFHTGMGIDVRNLTNISSSRSGGQRDRQHSYRLRNLVHSNTQGNHTVPLPAEDEQSLASTLFFSAPSHVSSKSKIESRTTGRTIADAKVIQKTIDWSVHYDDNNNT